MATSAVITADIVNSTLLTTANEKRLINEISSLLTPNKYEFYRGDSFQVYVKDAKTALPVLLRARAAARKFSIQNDVRASIGIGKVSSHLRKLSTATDEAFVLSGRYFDTLIKNDNRLTIQSSNSMANHAFKVISYFIDYIFNNLTEKQAEVFFILLANTTQVEAAKRLKKTQSTINKHVQSGGWYELLGLLDEYEAIISKL